MPAGEATAASLSLCRWQELQCLPCAHRVPCSDAEGSGLVSVVNVQLQLSVAVSELYKQSSCLISSVLWYS